MDCGNSRDDLHFESLAEFIEDSGESGPTVNPTSQLVGNVVVVAMPECLIEDSGRRFPRSFSIRP